MIVAKLLLEPVSEDQSLSISFIYREYYVEKRSWSTARTVSTVDFFYRLGSALCSIFHVFVVFYAVVCRISGTVHY